MGTGNLSIRYVSRSVTDSLVPERVAKLGSFGADAVSLGPLHLRLNPLQVVASIGAGDGHDTQQQEQHAGNLHVGNNLRTHTKVVTNYCHGIIFS